MVQGLEYDGKSIDLGIFGNAVFLDDANLSDDDREPDRILKDALDEYINRNGSSEFEKNDIGLIINDRNRPTPTHLVFQELLRRYPDIGSRISKVHIATGTHLEPSEDDLKAILGDTYGSLSEKVHIHRADRENEHKTVGITSRGTDVRFDSEIFDHGMLLIINSVEPHYFAGYTGGRKSLLPGMAWFNTVEKNHSHALHPCSKTSGLKGNPVHEDMEEAVEMFLRERKHLTFQLVQGPGKILTNVVIGDIFSAFVDGVSIAEKQFCIDVEGKADIVISFAQPPMDRTLYQAQKAIENGKIALKEGGTLILVAACREGIGNSTFWDLLTSSDNEASVLRSIEMGYKLGYHKAAKIAALSSHSNIYMVSRVDPEILSKGFIKGFETVEDAFKEAISISGEDPTVLIIPDGTVTVPKPQG